MSTKRLTQDDFVARCKQLYGNTLTYQNTVYKNTRSPVTLTCRKHGDFERNARGILNGVGCPDCNTNWNKYVKSRRHDTETFVQKAQDLHEGFYTYTKTEYVNSRTNVTITCPIHGDFSQLAGGHLEGYGCKKCADKKHGDYRPWLVETYFGKYPEKKDVPAKLYLLYSEEENFYKVGITIKDVADRIKYMRHYNFKVVDYVESTMYNCAIAEQKILKEAKTYKPKIRFGGYSECIEHKVNIHKYVPSRVGNPYREG